MQHGNEREDIQNFLNYHRIPHLLYKIANAAARNLWAEFCINLV